MNDLSGLDWDASTSSSRPPSQANYNTDRYTSLRPTPPTQSRQPSPLSATGRTTPGTAASASAKPTGQDSFAGLLGGPKKANSLSLQERQKQILEEKLRQSGGLSGSTNDPFRTNDATFWEGLGSGRSTPSQAAAVTPAITSVCKPTDDEDDILAAFNAAAPVDRSSHFPVPTSRNGTSDTGIADTRPRPAPLPSHSQPPPAAKQSQFDAEDNDPFGLGQMPERSRPNNGAVQMAADADDDVLGLLGQPVEHVPRPTRSRPQREPSPERTAPTGMNDPRDKAIAELVDMGFDADRSRMALDQTSNGTDVQGAVSWLLNSAHEEARSRSRAQNNSNAPAPEVDSRKQRPAQRRDEERSASSGPAWLQPGRPDRADNRSPNSGDKDVAQVASEFGNQMWKSANSLWKTGQKRMQKAVAEFQQEGNEKGDDGQPRWMREAERRDKEGRSTNRNPAQPASATDEAMMLEPGRAPERRPERRPEAQRESMPTQAPRRRPGELPEATLPARPTSRPTQKLSRQAVEEESMQAYVSPARRKKATPAPESRPAAATAPKVAPQKPDETFDIFSGVAAPIAANPSASARPASSNVAASKARTPAPTKPKAAPRTTPSVSSIALQTSTSHRNTGTAAFKRGDFASASSSYVAALTPLPPTHPIAILLHTNLALTYLKIGDAKASLASSTAALELIGPSRGEAETIDLGAEGSRDMKDLYAKSLTRKAEALEHLEKYVDAAATWQEAVSYGVGGAIAIAGRTRCEKALAPKAAPVAASRKPAATAPTRPRPTPVSSLAISSQPPSEAVTRLRAQNAAAVAASDEAFALNDSVTSRIDGWKTGKEGNLRALLASLDTVLWSGANWTKVGMGDLVMPNKVKIVYMKAIGRVHPDKIPQDATTEQKMVSASVFAALNEAWDKFKRDNGMA